MIDFPYIIIAPSSSARITFKSHLKYPDKFLTRYPDSKLVTMKLFSPSNSNNVQQSQWPTVVQQQKVLRFLWKGIERKKANTPTHFPLILFISFIKIHSCRGSTGCQTFNNNETLWKTFNIFSPTALTREFFSRRFSFSVCGVIFSLSLDRGVFGWKT